MVFLHGKVGAANLHLPGRPVEKTRAVEKPGKTPAVPRIPRWFFSWLERSLSTQNETHNINIWLIWLMINIYIYI